MENREKQIFDKAQEKQAKIAKKFILFTFCGIGSFFTIMGLIAFQYIPSFPSEMSTVFIALGIFMLLMGVILYLVIPTKLSYDKFKSRSEKYGVLNMYEMNAKISELEERIQALEQDRKL